MMLPKILVVDDEDYIRSLLAQSLDALAGHSVEILSASNGVEALEYIKTELPVLIFLDVMMPIMNGYDVCRIVKRELKFTDLFIIMMTERGQEFDKGSGLEVGADMYISKPFDPDGVLQLAQDVLNKRQVS